MAGDGTPRGTAKVIQGELRLGPGKELSLVVGKDKDGVDILEPLEKHVSNATSTLSLIVQLNKSNAVAAPFDNGDLLEALKVFLRDYANNGIFGSVTTGQSTPLGTPPPPQAPRKPPGKKAPPKKK